MRSKIGLYKYVKHIKVSESDYNEIINLKLDKEPIGRVISLLLLQLKMIPEKGNIFYDLSEKYKKKVDDGISKKANN